LFQSAITGTGFFLIALLAYQLAVRLAREEANAEHSQRAAQSQALVNQLVIERLSVGILVVDAHGVVRTANPAARHLLGNQQGPAPAHFLLPSLTYCNALTELVHATFEQQAEQSADLTIEPNPELRHKIHAHTHLTPISSEPSNEIPTLCVLFLEDRLELEAQLRTEKLAAMGRMSVAVAHEIRNPLSAIAQANALLREDLQDPLQLRLADMIGTHTQRLNRIVDDVLNVVRVPSRPVAPGSVPPILIDNAVQEVLDEWCGQHQCDLRMISELTAPACLVVFDPEHLRRILVNLLDNASRYASHSAHAIQVSTHIEASLLRVSVWSDGVPLDATVHRHLFEPFFSSESRSSGLGLYLCRELAERYSASLNYQRGLRQTREGNDFYLLIPIAIDPAVASVPTHTFPLHTS
jgi:two-component system sensor histidine kinase PilS (NtrC family)